MQSLSRNCHAKLSSLTRRTLYWRDLGSSRVWTQTESMDRERIASEWPRRFLTAEQAAEYLGGQTHGPYAVGHGKATCLPFLSAREDVVFRDSSRVTLMVGWKHAGREARMPTRGAHALRHMSRFSACVHVVSVACQSALCRVARAESLPQHDLHRYTRVSHRYSGQRRNSPMIGTPRFQHGSLSA